jgi:predicted ArsR family transcriptional regulator
MPSNLGNANIPPAARQSHPLRSPSGDSRSSDTRSAILGYLGDHPPATVALLAATLNLTPADIRYHLKVLRGEGLVEALPHKAAPSPGRGRPARAYRLAPAQQRNNLPALCHALLSVYLGGAALVDGSAAGDAQDSHSPAERMADLAATLAANQSPLAGSLPLRLAQAVEWLNRRQYRARWEAGARGPRLLLRRCPYAVLLAEHPELCEIDRMLLEKVVSVSLRQTDRQNPVTGRPPACVFEVKS